MSAARKIRTLAVTGGTGFVGGHLLAWPRARRATRSARSTRGWRPPEDGIDWVDGALDRPDSLAKLAAGADAVDPRRRPDQRARPRRLRGGQCRRHRGDDRRRAPRRRAPLRPHLLARRARAGAFRLWLVEGPVGAAGRRLGARLDDRAAARGLRPRRPRDVRIVQDGPARPRRAAAQGPLLGHPCRGSVPADPRRGRRARDASARPTSPTTAPRTAGTTAISPAPWAASSASARRRSRCRGW